MIIVFVENEPKCSKCYDRKAKIAFMTSNVVIAKGKSAIIVVPTVFRSVPGWWCLRTRLCQRCSPKRGWRPEDKTRLRGGQQKSYHRLGPAKTYILQRPWVYPYPSVSDFAGTKLRPWSKQNSDQNSDHTRLCIYHGKRNSDHGLSFWEEKTQTMV